MDHERPDHGRMNGRGNSSGVMGRRRLALEAYQNPPVHVTRSIGTRATLDGWDEWIDGFPDATHDSCGLTFDPHLNEAKKKVWWMTKYAPSHRSNVSTDQKNVTAN